MGVVGILPLGRPTFDVDYANEKLAGMLAALDATAHQIVGPRTLLFDADATKAAMAELEAADIDTLLLLQVTFTDASMTVAAANVFNVPLAIWAVPEPRVGGRLRLNAFCGLNLASHALGLADRTFGWLYADPGTGMAADLDELLAGGRQAGDIAPQAAQSHRSPAGDALAQSLQGRRIGRLGAHPVGFDTCAYDADTLSDLAGVAVDDLPLTDLFDAANGVTDANDARAQADAVLEGLDDVDQAQLDRSLKLKTALDQIRGQGAYDAFAIRCWPETFTEYGGAVCGPVAMMGEAQVPCACEADVYGALSQLLLQSAAREPVFLVDLVDVDITDNSGVVWHCGQAPISMADPARAPSATIHTNRKMPLLFEFTLKPGPVTLMRMSQARGRQQMILAKGEVLGREMSFTGTSGVVRFDTPADVFLSNVIDSRLEHHMALAYGDHMGSLRSAAAALDLPIIEL